MAASSTNHESTVAREAARQMIETLQATPFDEVFVTYNLTNLDDPGGLGTAPGVNFDVPGLDARDGDADGLVGEIIFPTTNGLTVNESVVDRGLGCPRDLNGDGDTDDNLGNGLFSLLPVVVRLEWRGSSGQAKFELRTQLADY